MQVDDRCAVAVDGLVKRYPRAPVNAVDGISFTVARGEIFGLLGPNGAGKTTTVGVLTTRVRPDAGSARVGGLDVVRHAVAARRQLAVVPQRSNLDRSLSIRDNLLFHAAYHGVPAAEREHRADRLLDQFGLGARARSKPNFFSGGQEQRVMIARALMHAPAVLFLDEPTTGLDPAARLFVWDRLRELRDGGVTLLLTTHDMDEAAQLADRVGIMDRGRLLALDTPAALVRSLPGSSTLELTVDASPGAGPHPALAALAAVPGVEKVEPLAAGGDGGPEAARRGTGTKLRVYGTGDPARLVAPVLETLTGNGLSVGAVRFGAQTLEDVFIDLTGRELR